MWTVNEKREDFTRTEGVLELNYGGSCQIRLRVKLVIENKRESWDNGGVEENDKNRTRRFQPVWQSPFAIQHRC